jgi:hypothetical protein
MLFDLQGKRRRVVQATYLILAVLMGGGLVFFGIGSDVSGGLFDIFGERGGSGNPAEEQVENAEKRLQTRPDDERALTQLVRGHYQLATQEGEGAQSETGAFPPEARDELARAGRAWQRYLATEPERVDPALAGLMLNAYGQGGLNQPKNAVRAAELAAEAQPNQAQAWLQVVLYASLAGDTRKADLAGIKALDVAPRDQRSTVKAAVEQAKQAGQQAQGQAGGQTPGTQGQQGGSTPGGTAP